MKIYMAIIWTSQHEHDTAFVRADTHIWEEKKNLCNYSKQNYRIICHVKCLQAANQFSNLFTSNFVKIVLYLKYAILHDFLCLNLFPFHTWCRFVAFMPTSFFGCVLKWICMHCMSVRVCVYFVLHCNRLTAWCIWLHFNTDYKFAIRFCSRCTKSS